MKNFKQTDVVILCGGMGKRLRSQIGESQKVMAPIGEMPFLELLIGSFKKQNFKRIILCTGYKSEAIEEFFKNKDIGIDIVFSSEKEPLGTGGAIKNAKIFIETDPFIALNGDCFCDLDYNELIKYHLDKEALGTIAVSKVKASEDFGWILLDKSNRILEFKEKQKAVTDQYVNAGVYCLNLKAFDCMPERSNFSIEYDFFQKIAGKDLFGFPVGKGFYDIGTPQRYLEAKKILERK